MTDGNITAEALVSDTGVQRHSQVVLLLATVCLVWYVAVTLVSTLGYVQM